MKTNVNNISFNVSKTINIGNFEAIKINYGESITVDPTKPLEIQREKMIESCYAVVKKEAEIWTGLKAIQHVDNNKTTNPIKPRSFRGFKDQQQH